MKFDIELQSTDPQPRQKFTIKAIFETTVETEYLDWLADDGKVPPFKETWEFINWIREEEASRGQKPGSFFWELDCLDDQTLKSLDIELLD